MSIAAIRAAEPRFGPDAKIDALISHIETLPDAKTVRSGSEYDSKDAARFLRAKWIQTENT